MTDLFALIALSQLHPDHVRTAAGAMKFGQPIDSIIVPDADKPHAMLGNGEAAPIGKPSPKTGKMVACKAPGSSAAYQVPEGAVVYTPTLDKLNGSKPWLLVHLPDGSWRSSRSAPPQPADACAIHRVRSGNTADVEGAAA